MFKPRRLAFALILAVISSLPGAGSAFAYPSSYQNTWDFFSRDGVHCSWTVFDRAYASSLYPTYDQVKVTQWVDCSDPIHSIDLYQEASYAANLHPAVDDTLRRTSNTVNGTNAPPWKGCDDVSSCTVTATWDGIPRGRNVTIDPQDAWLSVYGSGDIWISAPCQEEGTFAGCSAPITLTTP